MEEGLRSSHSIERNNSKSIPLEVTTEKTFQVTEVFQEPQGLSENTFRWGSMSQPEGKDLEEEIERATSGLGLRDWEFSEAHEDHFGPGTAR